MIASVCGKPFIPFKATLKYLGNMFSIDWLYANEGRNGFPKRVYLSERKTGYWKSDLDTWRDRRRRGIKRKAA